MGVKPKHLIQPHAKSKMFIKLTDQACQILTGGYANPENNGNGSINSGSNGFISVFKSASASDTSPNSPKFGYPGGVSNADHFFQNVGAIGWAFLKLISEMILENFIGLICL